MVAGSILGGYSNRMVQLGAVGLAEVTLIQEDITRFLQLSPFVNEIFQFYWQNSFQVKDKQITNQLDLPSIII